MKQYILFGWQTFYPIGGTQDIIGTYEFYYDAIKGYAETNDEYDNYEILDTVTGKIHYNYSDFTDPNFVREWEEAEDTVEEEIIKGRNC